MTIRKIVIASILGLAFYGTPDAQAQSYGECTDPKTTESAITCLADAVAKSDAELQRRRERLSSLLKTEPHLLVLFEESERQWSAYKSSMCDKLIFEFYEGGTIQLPNTLACRLDATRGHIEILGRLFRQQLK